MDTVAEEFDTARFQLAILIVDTVERGGNDLVTDNHKVVHIERAIYIGMYEWHDNS